MQAELLVSVRPFGVVDAGDHSRHSEDVLGDLGRHDVAVVALRYSDEAVGVLDARPPQDFRVGSVADDLVALEIVCQHSARRRAGELVRVAIDDHHLVARLVHVGGQLGTHPTAADNEELQGALIIGRHSRRLSPLLLAFGPVRFPFTFMGVLALGIGMWVVAYLSVHRNMDPVSQGIAASTIVLFWGFGGYVLLRRVWRGPQS